MEQQARKFKEPKSFDDLYPGRFLKADSFGGRKVTLTILACRREELTSDKGPSVKAIVSFKETPLELVACKTNGLCMRDMFGKSLAGWIGKRVILFPGVWAGEPAIRVWGSPDIKAPFDIEIKLARKKPFTMRMHTSAAETGPTAKTTAETYPEEESEDPGMHPDDLEPGSDG